MLPSIIFSSICVYVAKVASLIIYFLICYFHKYPPFRLYAQKPLIRKGKENQTILVFGIDSELLRLFLGRLLPGKSMYV